MVPEKDLKKNNEPHSMNVRGPFYVVSGCCASCDLPLAEAPEFFAYDEKAHCYVKRQPRTKDEYYKAFRVALYADLECIRYRGDDPDMLRRFAEAGQPEKCDIPAPAEIQPVFRNHVTFHAINPADVTLDAAEIAAEFRDYLRSNSHHVDYKFTRVIEGETSASFSFAWFENDFHLIEFNTIDLPDSRWLIRHSPVEKLGSRLVSDAVHDWLISDGRFSSIRWYSEQEWNSSKHWNDTPS